MDKLTNYIIRPLHPNEYHLLKEFLYEAIYIPEGVKPPAKEIVDLPELKVYIENFGTQKDDFCLIAEIEGKVIGAVWSRIMNDYGHIDNETPSLSISLYKEYRGKGIGSHLMQKLIKSLGDKGYKCVSLSVQKANYAVNMYIKLGFKIIKETNEEFIMVKELTEKKSNYEHFLSGEYCNRIDNEVLNMIKKTKGLLSIINDIKVSAEERRNALSQMFGKIGKHSNVGNNFTCRCSIFTSLIISDHSF